MNNLTNDLPNMSFSKEDCEIIENLKLADPAFNSKGPIDFLMAADIHAMVLLNGLIKSNSGALITQRTELGWIEMLSDSLSDIYKGHMDMHLFPASQLIEQLNIISGKLPQGLSLPVKDIHQDLPNLYELIHVKARVTNNYLMFELHIPLLSDEEYQLYKIIPIPFMRQGRLKRIRPSSEFIAINFIKNSYITMDETKMQQCTAYGKEQFGCAAYQPIYNLHNKNAPCEAKVFSQQSTLSCILDDIECTETWTKLHRPNLWLFTICKKHMIRILCDDQVISVALEETGFITLKPKCILQKKDATIYTYNHFGSNMQMSADIDVPTINSSINNLFNLNWNNAQLNITEFKTMSSLNFSKIEEQIHYQKEHEKLPVTSHLSVHDIYLYSVTTLLLGGILAGAIVYACIKRRKSEEKKYTPPVNPIQKPARRNETDIEMQDFRNSSLPDQPYSEVKPKQTRFRFDQ
ncbi:baculovirus F protein domain-containing protein [Phthorimaea operculella]|nr:baculovirus F protein domain-containing protein [Phthorimaea operculella]